MFKLINFIASVQIYTHFDLDVCNTFQNSWDGGNKRLRKLRNALKTPVWNIPQVNQLIGNRLVIGYRRRIHKRLSHSQARMGWGSPLCEQLCEQIVLPFKSNIARNWGISSSAVNDIIKKFRDPGEISACKRQGQRTTLTACDLWSHHSVKDITTLAQEHIRKPLSVNKVCRHIYKCKLKLYNAKWTTLLLTTSRNVAGFSGHELIWDGLKQSGKVCCGPASPHFKLF